jgi:hypothetical protein
MFYCEEGNAPYPSVVVREAPDDLYPGKPLVCEFSTNAVAMEPIMKNPEVSLGTRELFLKLQRREAFNNHPVFDR